VVENLEPDAGTTELNPTDGDAAGTVEDAGAAGGVAGEKKVTIPAHEYQGLQKNAEELNVVKQQVAQLIAAQGAGVTAPTPPARAGIVADDDEEDLLAEVRAAAKGGDKASRAFLKGLEKAERLNEHTRYLLEMTDVPALDREEVTKYMTANGIPSVKYAYRLINEERQRPLVAKVASLEKELEELRKQRPAPPPKDTRLMGEGAAGKDATAAKGEKYPLSRYKEDYASHDPKRIAAAKSAEREGRIDINR
jgi:hypothetical protein